jgi:O-antigen/teichoic acid export membrane protein
MGIDLVQTGLVYTIQPKVFTIWKDNNLTSSTPQVNRYYNGFTAITLLVLPIVTIAIPLLAPIVIKNQVYYQAFAFIGILCLGYAFRPAFYFFLAPLFYFKKTKVLPRVFFFSALIQVLMSSALVYKFGLMGAVWSNFMIKPIQALFLYLESRKVFSFHINRWKIILLPVTVFITGALLFSFYPDRTGLIPGIIQLFITGFLVYFTYRNEIPSILNFRTRKIKS